MSTTLRIPIVTMLALVATSLAAAEPTLIDVDTVRTAQDAFQKARGDVRILAIVSPTSVFGVDSVRALESDVASIPAGAALQVFVIWTPTNGGDDLAVARARSAEVVEGDRTTFFWDRRRQVAHFLQGTFELPGLAEGMFLLYDRGADWKVDEPPLPTFWMQRNDRLGRRAPSFDAKTFATRVRELLGSDAAR